MVSQITDFPCVTQFRYCSLFCLLDLKCKGVLDGNEETLSTFLPFQKQRPKMAANQSMTLMVALQYKALSNVTQILIELSDLFASGTALSNVSCNKHTGVCCRTLATFQWHIPLWATLTGLIHMKSKAWAPSCTQVSW